MILGAIIILLIGVCVWGVFGRLDTKLPATVMLKNGKAVCYIKEADAKSINEGMTVEVNGSEYKITSIADKPTQLSPDMGEYFFHAGDLTVNEWVYEAELDANGLSDEIYQAQIILDSVSPMSFIMN